jgi:hypothetical protein
MHIQSIDADPFQRSLGSKTIAIVAGAARDFVVRTRTGMGAPQISYFRSYLLHIALWQAQSYSRCGTDPRLVRRIEETETIHGGTA